MTANPDFKPGDEPYLMISDGLGKEMPVMYLVEQRLIASAGLASLGQAS